MADTLSTRASRSKTSNLKLVLLYLTIFSLPFDIWSVTTITGRGVKPIWVMGTLLIAAFIVNVLYGNLKVKKSKTGTWVLVFNAVALLSLANLVNTSSSHLIDFATVWVQLAFVTLLFFTVTSLDLSRQQFQRVLQVWIGLAFVLSVYALYQVVARPLDLPLAYLPITNPSIGGGPITRGGAFGPFIRPSSVFAEPSFFGSFLISPLFLTALFWFYRKRAGAFLYRNLLLNWIVFWTIALAFLFSFSMGAYAAVGGALVVMFLNRRLLRKVLLYGSLLALVFVSLGWATETFLGANFAQIVVVRATAHLAKLDNPTGRAGIDSPYARTSVGNRFRRAMAAFSVWKEQPLTGVGLNNFRYYYPNDVAPLVHSGFIQVLAGMGIWGAIGLGTILLSALAQIRSWVKLPSLKPDEWVLLLGFYYSIWAFAIELIIARGWTFQSFWMTLALSILSLHWVIGRHRSVEGRSS